jgi:hypothetical protein
MKRRTTPPKPYLPPQTRTRHRLSHRPHRQSRCGVIPLPQGAPHPTNHVQQETHPTDNPHSRRGRTGRERHDVEADVDEGDPQVQTGFTRACWGEVCFFVLCNRHWFNKAPGPDPRGTELEVTYLPFAFSSDASCADLPLPLLGAPVSIEALVKLGCVLIVYI